MQRINHYMIGKPTQAGIDPPQPADDTRYAIFITTMPSTLAAETARSAMLEMWR